MMNTTHNMSAHPHGMQQQQKQANTFPQLPEDNIVNILNELGINMNLKQLRAPTAEFAEPLLIHLTQELSTFRYEDLLQKPPNFDAMSNMQYPQLHEESVVKVETFMAIQKFLGDIGVSSFSLRDLMYPRRRQLSQQLSAILNYASFCNQLKEEYRTISETANAYMAKRDEVSEQYNKIKEELDQYLERDRQDAPQVEQLTQETNEMQQRLKQLSQQQAEMDNTYESLQEECDRLKTMIESESARLELITGECRELEKQIVRDPEQLKQHIDGLTKSVEGMRSAYQRGEQRRAELLQRNELVKRAEKDIGKALALMKEIESDQSHLATSSSELKDQRAEIDSMHENTASMGNQQAHLQRQICAMQDKIARMRRKNESDMEAARDASEDAMKERRMIQKAREQQQAAFESNQQAIADMRERIAQVKHDHVEQMQRMVSVHEYLENQVNQYNSQLLQSIGEATD